MTIVWTTTALKRLDEIARQIARDDPERARTWVDEVFARVEGLKEFPQMGRVVPELGKPHIRELIFDNYRVIYGISPRRISIRTVRHVRQLL